MRLRYLLFFVIVLMALSAPAVMADDTEYLWIIVGSTDNPSGGSADDGVGLFQLAARLSSDRTAEGRAILILITPHIVQMELETWSLTCNDNNPQVMIWGTAHQRGRSAWFEMTLIPSSTGSGNATVDIWFKFTDEGEPVVLPVEVQFRGPGSSDICDGE